MLMDEQVTNRILMVRPAAFGFNPETAPTNAFQVDGAVGNPSAQALEEFDRYTRSLREAGVIVEIADDTAFPKKPDAVFPNNWVSFHPGGMAVLYPMAAESRRNEVRPELLEALGLKVALDLRVQADDKSLEGTGSLVLDRVNRLAYACISPRTDARLVESFCRNLDFTPVLFNAFMDGKAIYHTNVLLSIGERTAIVCKELIDESSFVLSSLQTSGKRVLEVSRMQVTQFACNALQLRGAGDTRFWTMSARAWSALDMNQKERLQEEGEIVTSDLSTIERLSGGSARCMIAEIF